jgi:hypothetical protein
MWMWIFVEISIYHTFIASLQIILWNENFQINHMVSKHGSYYVKWHFNIPSTFIKIKNHVNFFWNIFVFFGTLDLFPQIYSNLPLYNMKWNNLFSNFLPMLYYNIIWKKKLKIFQRFEVKHIQTCTSMESSTMWHPKGVHHSVLSPCCCSWLWCTFYF